MQENKKILQKVVEGKEGTLTKKYFKKFSKYPVQMRNVVI